MELSAIAMPKTGDAEAAEASTTTAGALPGGAGHRVRHLYRVGDEMMPASSSRWS